LGFDLERGYVLAPRGADHPPVIPAELGRILLAEAERVRQFSFSRRIAHAIR